MADKVSDERDTAVIYLVRPIVHAGRGARRAEDVFGDVQEVGCGSGGERRTTVSGGKVVVKDRGGCAAEGRV